MKPLFFLLLFCCSISRSFAQAGKDEQAIRDLLGRQTASWNQGNIAAFMKGYWQNDSLLFIGKSGVTHGYQNTLDHYKKSYADTVQMGKLSFDILKVTQLSPEYYWVLGRWFLKRSVGDVNGSFTLLFRKINGQWVIIADHSS